MFLVCGISAPAWAKVAVGEPAPDFSLTDSNGKTQTLSQYKGKIVVLEWNNPECPFVGKHYNSGNMPATTCPTVPVFEREPRPYFR